MAFAIFLASSPAPPAQPEYLQIVRHGQSTWNAQARVQGQLDVSRLTAAGTASAVQLGRDCAASGAPIFSTRLSDLAVYTSPLTRARQSYDALAAGLNPAGPASVTRDARLSEARFPWQGRFKSELTELDEYREWKRDPLAFTSADGISPLKEVRARADSFLDGVGDGDAMIVAHNQTNRAVLGAALGLPYRDHFLFRQDNACLNVLERVPVRGRGRKNAYVLLASNITATTPEMMAASVRQGQGGQGVVVVLTADRSAPDSELLQKIVSSTSCTGTLCRISATAASVSAALQHLLGCHVKVVDNSVSILRLAPSQDQGQGACTVVAIEALGVPTCETRAERIGRILR